MLSITGKPYDTLDEVIGIKDNASSLKSFGVDYNFDARNLKNKDVFEKIKEYAPSENVKKDIEKIDKNSKLFKNVATSKFIVATALTVGSYIGLTRLKQKYTCTLRKI